jgi:hypothetical protein
VIGCRSTPGGNRSIENVDVSVAIHVVLHETLPVGPETVTAGITKRGASLYDNFTHATSELGITEQGLRLQGIRAYALSLVDSGKETRDRLSAIGSTAWRLTVGNSFVG